MAIPFPYLSAHSENFGLPSNADGFAWFFAAEFSLHDLYHALVMGKIPEKKLRALTTIGWYLNRAGDGVKRDDEKIGKCLETLGELILDMDLNEYSFPSWRIPSKEALQADCQNEVPCVDAKGLKRIDMTILMNLKASTDRLRFEEDIFKHFLTKFIAEYLPYIRSVCAKHGVGFSGEWRLIDSSS